MESHPLSKNTGKRTKLPHDSFGMGSQTIREREAEQRMKKEFSKKFHIFLDQKCLEVATLFCSCFDILYLLV